MKSRFPLLTSTLAVFSLSSCVTAGVEKAAYTVEKKDGNFEVRAYPALKVAVTAVEDQGRRGGDGSFMRLFRYIGGDNEPGRQIAMTAPVLMDTNNGPRTMGFIVPQKVAASGEVPKPKQEDVRLSDLAAGRFATLRFRGSGTPAQEEAAWARLKEWTGKAGLRAAGQPLYAYFDPPWTPVPLRRNEVMVRVE